MICSCDTFHSWGALKVANESRYVGLSILTMIPMMMSARNVTSTSGLNRFSLRRLSMELICCVMSACTDVSTARMVDGENGLTFGLLLLLLLLL